MVIFETMLGFPDSFCKSCFRSLSTAFLTIKSVSGCHGGVYVVSTGIRVRSTVPDFETQVSYVLLWCQKEAGDYLPVLVPMTTGTACFYQVPTTAFEPAKLVSSSALTAIVTTPCCHDSHSLNCCQISELIACYTEGIFALRASNKCATELLTLTFVLCALQTSVSVLLYLSWMWLYTKSFIHY